MTSSKEENVASSPSITTIYSQSDTNTPIMASTGPPTSVYTPAAERNSTNYPSRTMLAGKRKYENCDIRHNEEAPKKKLKFFPTNRKGMTVCADHGWQKKGFDSLTGHTFFISKQNKVLKTVVKHRTCGKCKWWRRHRPGRRPPPHRCVWNHTGSSKLMESEAGLEAVQSMAKQGTPVEIIEGDGDNTLISRARSQLGISLRKKLDRNHCIKNIVKLFYELKAQKYKISNQVIEHLSKCVKYVFAKNQGNLDHMRENLIAFVPHQFGDHSHCHPRFCGYKRANGESYVHRSLPYKAPLHDPQLKTKLTEIFAPIIDKAALYIDLGSSQACEHANRAVSLRAPKHLHYGESESLDHRVKATAASINEGRKYLTEVAVVLVVFASIRLIYTTFRRNGLSPGHFTEKHARKLDTYRVKKSIKSKLPETKRRRLILKQERAIRRGAAEATEGSSYQSGIGLHDKQDINKIPDAIVKPSFSQVSLPNAKPSYVVIDLETTGLITRNIIPHITQIACLDSGGKTEFSTYILPKLPMDPGAEKATGIVFDGSYLVVKGQRVDAVPIKDALKNFISWISQFENVFLIAHNGRIFDFRVLSFALQNCGLQSKFTECVTGCVDSLTVIKHKFPKLNSYKQECLASHFGLPDYNAHNAVDDVHMLHQIVSVAMLSDKEMMKASYRSHSHFQQEIFNKAKAENIGSLHVLVGKGIIKMSMAENIAGSGLSLAHLQLVHKRDGEDGLLCVFSAKNSEGKPRVTSNTKILDTIIPKLCEYFTSS